MNAEQSKKSKRTMYVVVLIVAIAIIVSLAVYFRQNKSVDTVNKSLQQLIISDDEFNAMYSECLTNDEITDSQRREWNISTNTAAACQEADQSWYILIEQNELDSTYRMLHISKNGDLIAKSEDGVYCGGPIALPSLKLTGDQLTCARLSAGCGSVKTWKFSSSGDTLKLQLISNQELCVD